MSELNEKTKVPLGLMIVAITTAIGLAGAAAVAQFRVDNHDTRLDHVEAAEHSHDVHLGEHDVMFRSMKETMERIDRNVEDLRHR